jgi:hypothetical protein
MLANKLQNYKLHSNEKILIESRIKNLNAKKLIVSFCNKISNIENIEFDGFLKFLKNSKSGIIKQKDTTKSVYTLAELVILDKKLRSTISNLKSIGCIIHREEKTCQRN